MASQAGSTGTVSKRQATGTPRSRVRIWLGRMGYVVLALLGLAGVAFAVYQLYLPRQAVQVDVTNINNIPVTVFRPVEDRGSAVVIAHGFSGSQQLMYPFALTLARNGYTAVTFDFPGHGQNIVPLQGDTFANEGRTQQLLETLDQVVAFARDQSDGAVGLLGHSVGSEIVTRYAQLHADEVAAVVAVSLVYNGVTPTSPPNLLVLTGALEPALRPLALNVADQAVMGGLGELAVTYGAFAQGNARRVVLVPWVGHIGVLYSPVSMDEALRWFDQAYEQTSGVSPYLDNRAPWMGLLFLSMLVLFWPFALLLQPLRLPATDADLRTFTWPWWTTLGLLPALLTPAILWGIRSIAGPVIDDLLPIEVGGSLALLFAIYGLLTALVWWFWLLVRQRRTRRGRRAAMDREQDLVAVSLPVAPGVLEEAHTVPAEASPVPESVRVAVNGETERVSELHTAPAEDDLPVSLHKETTPEESAGEVSEQLSAVSAPVPVELDHGDTEPATTGETMLVSTPEQPVSDEVPDAAYEVLPRNVEPPVLASSAGYATIDLDQYVLPGFPQTQGGTDWEDVPEDTAGVVPHRQHLPGRKQRRGHATLSTRPLPISQMTVQRRARSDYLPLRSTISLPAGVGVRRTASSPAEHARPASLPVPVQGLRTRRPPRPRHLPVSQPVLLDQSMLRAEQAVSAVQPEALPATMYASYTTLPVQEVQEAVVVEPERLPAPPVIPAAPQVPAKTKAAQKPGKSKRSQAQPGTLSPFLRVLAAVAIALLVAGFVFLLSGVPAHLFIINFFPPVERLWIVAVIFVALLPYFLADEAVTRGSQRPWGIYVVTKLCFTLALILSIAVNPSLFFLVFTVPLFIGYFILYGLLSWRVHQRTRSIVPGALANAFFFAWIIGVTFPLV